MSNKALITRRAGTAEDRTPAAAIADMRQRVILEAETPSGALVRGTDARYEALQAAGFRVKLLPDTNLLHIGRYTIDVELTLCRRCRAQLEISAADLQDGLTSGAARRPAIESWVREIEARGIDVVEPVSGYAVFVHATSEAVTALRDLPFVVWTGPLKPAYRIASSAAENVDYISVRVYPSSEAEVVRGRSGRHRAASSTSHANPQPTAVNTPFSECTGQRSRRSPACGMSVGWRRSRARSLTASANRRSLPKTWMEPRARHGARSRLPIVAVAGRRQRHRRHDCDRRQRRRCKCEQRHGGCARGFARTSGGVRRLLERRRCHRHGRSWHTRGRHCAGKCCERTSRGRGAQQFSMGTGRCPWRAGMSRRMRFIAACIRVRPSRRSRGIRRATAPRS